MKALAPFGSLELAKQAETNVIGPHECDGQIGKFWKHSHGVQVKITSILVTC